MAKSSSFPKFKTKTVRQLFELPKNLDQNRWELDRTSQDQNPNVFGSWLNFQRLSTKTVGQLFEIRKTLDQNH